MARIVALSAAFSARSIQNVTRTSYTQVANVSSGVRAALNTTFYFSQFAFHGTVRLVSENGPSLVGVNGTDAFLEFPFTMPSSTDSGISGFAFQAGIGTQLIVGEVLISGFASGTVKALPLYLQASNKLKLLLPSKPDNPLTVSPVYKIDGTNNTIDSINVGRNISIIGGTLFFFDDFGLQALK